MATVSPFPNDPSSPPSRGASSGKTGGLPRSDSPEGRAGEMPTALPLPLALDKATRLEPGLAALNDLRMKMMQWTLADYLNAFAKEMPAEKGTAPMAKETLEHLLLRVLSQPGGEARLLAALPDLPRTAVVTLLHAGLDAALLQADSKNGKNPELNARASSLMRLLLRAVETENPTRPATMQAAANVESKPRQQGLARVLQVESEGDVQAGPQDPKGLSPKPGTPLLRVSLWEEGRRFSVLASQAPVPGTLVKYVRAEPGQIVATLTPDSKAGSSNALGHSTSPTPAISASTLAPSSAKTTVLAPTPATLPLPPTLARTPSLSLDYAQANPRMREALAAAEETLAEVKSMPGYTQAVRDFAKVLGQMSWFAESPKEGLRTTVAEREGLLRLWLESPPKPTEETATLRSWGQVLREPAAALPVLRLFRPVIDARGQGNEVGDPVWLSEKTLLMPVDAKAKALLTAALGPRPPGQAEAGLTLEQWAQMPTGAESKDVPLRATLQALLPEPKSEAFSPPSPSPAMMNLFVFQAPQWHAVSVQGEALDPEKQRGQRSKSATPWTATVDWTGQTLGQAEAQVKLTEATIDLDLRNSGEPAGAQVSAETVTLAAALQAQGLDLRAVNYRHTPENDAPAPEASELRVPRPIHSVDLRF